MSPTVKKLDLPRQATPIRRLLHVCIAVVGWVLFVYWWWLVFSRVSQREVVITGIFVAVTTVVSVLVTSIWSIHNKRLHRRRSPREQVRSVQEDYSHDSLSRLVAFEDDIESLRDAPRVRVELVEDRKLYGTGCAERVGTVGDAGAESAHA